MYKGVFYVKNKKLMFFYIFLAIYILGLFVGTFSQIYDKNQADMYEYLKSAISVYEVSAKESIKGVFRENLKIILIILISGFFKISPFVSGGVIFIKGYTLGFATSAALRLFGISGLLLCGANFLSAMFLIPAIVIFGVFNIDNIRYNLDDKKAFLKTYLVLSIFLLIIFGADTVLRGALSSLFIKFSSSILIGG